MCLQNMPAPRPKKCCTSFCTRDAEHSTCDLMPSRFFQRQWQSLQGNNKGITISTSSIRNMFSGTIWCKHENPSKFTWYHVYQLCNWDLWSWGRIYLQGTNSHQAHTQISPDMQNGQNGQNGPACHDVTKPISTQVGDACGNRWSMMLLSFPATAKSPKTWLTDDSLMTSERQNTNDTNDLQPSTLPWQTLLLRKDRHISPRHLKCVPSALRLGGNLNKFE